jgi:hypothetical protein
MVAPGMEQFLKELMTSRGARDFFQSRRWQGSVGTNQTTRLNLDRAS